MGGFDNLNPVFAARLRQLVDRCGLSITSGYRSPERQRELYLCWILRKPGCNPANPPGTSNHEYGLAADLGGDLSCAARHARNFGLHFPIRGEPWHVECVETNGRYRGNPFPPEPPQLPRRRLPVPTQIVIEPGRDAALNAFPHDNAHPYWGPTWLSITAPVRGNVPVGDMVPVDGGANPPQRVTVVWTHGGRTYRQEDYQITPGRRWASQLNDQWECITVKNHGDRVVTVALEILPK